MLRKPCHPNAGNARQDSVVTTHPTLGMGGSKPGTKLKVPCSPLLIVRTRNLLLGSTSGLGGSRPCHFSIVSIRERVVAGVKRIVRGETTRTFLGESGRTFTLRDGHFLRVLRSISRLLHAHPRFGFSH